MGAMGLGAVMALAAMCAQPAPPVYGFQVVKAYPHDSSAFTQGLLFHDGYLYEGTGVEGLSSLRKVDLATGNVVKKYRLANDVFGEGITLHDGRIYQISWRNGIAFVYDLATFKLLRKHSYTGEGWGLATDGKRLILSDGTARLRFFDPETFAPVGKPVEVVDRGNSIGYLNELEYVKGEVWANVWHEDRIARIDPATGKVVGWIDLAGLLPASLKPDEEAVLNGIAWDAAKDRIFVTGKWWPRLYEIKLVKRA